MMPLSILGPLFLLIIAVSISGHLLQAGLAVSMETIRPKLEKLNPTAGFNRIFSFRGFTETLKVLIRTLAMVIIFRNFLVKMLPLIMKSPLMHPRAALSFYGSTVMGLFFQITLLLLVVGGLDYFLQRYLFLKQMRMTKQQIKEELKSTEGDPFLKQRIRSKQKEMIRRRMLDGVKTARVVITNPTQLAIALRFDEENDSAPVVAAKGQGYLAERIKEIARKHLIHIYENKPLARSLYKNVEIGDLIPPEMFKSVAEIIAFIEKLNDGMERGNYPAR